MGQRLVLAALIVLGAQMLSTVQAQGRSSTKTGALLLVTVGRLILAPLIAYAVGGLIGLDGLARKVLTLQAATPSAVMSLLLATEFDTDVPFAALAVLTTTLVSIVTVTGWLLWLMQGEMQVASHGLRLAHRPLAQRLRFRTVR